MFKESISAIFSAARLLFINRRVLALMLAAYAGLLGAVYLFVSTREATISQLVLTTTLVIVAPALFFVFQAASISYTSGPSLSVVMKSSLKIILVSVPVIGVTILVVYGLSKVDSYVTIATTLRYLLIGVVIPLLAIQLWIATSEGTLLRSLRKIALRTLAPQSVFVYVLGFLIFAVAPYFLIVKTIPAERAWLELSLLVLRLSTAALLIFLGWVTTVGAISIQNRGR